MENASNITNGSSTDHDARVAYYIRILTCFTVFEAFFILAGTFLNLWLVAAILTSKDMRARLRNQLICNVSICYLLQALVKSPVLVLLVLSYLHYDPDAHTFDFYCGTWSTITVVEYVQSFLGDWLLVFILVAFFAQVLDIDASSKLTPNAVKICEIVLHVLPWVAVVIATPVAIKSTTRWKCLWLSMRYRYIFEIVYSVIPIAAAVLLTLLAALLRYRRFTRGSSTAGGNMGVQLMGAGREIDGSLAYAVAVALCAGCEICNLIIVFEARNNFYRGHDFEIMSIVLSDSRVILMVLPWLLLPDIRQRIRTWRPGKPQAAGIDLTIAYQREA